MAFTGVTSFVQDTIFQGEAMEARFKRVADGLLLTAELPGKRHLECALSPPDGEVTFVDVLPEVFSICNALLEQDELAEREKGREVACAKGCGTCCRQLVAVSHHEALLLAHVVASLKAGERERIMAGFRSTVQALERAGLLAEIIESHANHLLDQNRVQEAQRRYWELQLPCPFLFEDACSIHPLRPLLCREFLATSDPALCAGNFKAGHLVRRVPLRYAVSSAAASFDGLRARPSSAVPLSTLFVVNGLLGAISRPKAPAKVILAAFLQHLVEHFRDCLPYCQ